MEITQLKVSFEFEKNPAADMAYRLYSCLISRIDREYGEYLHSQEALAVSHYLDRSGNWTVSLFGEEARRQLLPAFDEKRFNLRLGGFAEIKSIDIHQCEKIIGIGGNSKCHKFRFISPTAFKSVKRYRNFPTEELIAKSIIQKWRRGEERLISDELADRIASGIEISGYRLESTAFTLKTVNIPSFVGEVTITSHLDGMENRIWNSLADFANYSGIGIKTSLGMGGVKVEGL